MPLRWFSPLLVLALARPVAAAPFDGEPKILLHRAGITMKNQCEAGYITDCSSAVTSAGLNTPAFVYVLLAKGGLANVGGARFGIEYQDDCLNDMSDGQRLDVLGWTSCAQSQVQASDPQWPAPGAGITLFWSGYPECLDDSVIVAGYLYVSAAATDTLHLAPYSPSISAEVAQCTEAGGDLDRSDLGSMIFSAGSVSAGCNPCLESCPDPLPAAGPENCKVDPPPPPPPPPTNITPKLLLHVGSPVTKNPCGPGQIMDCANAQTSSDLSTSSGPFYFIYLLAAKGNLLSLAGLMVGIDYENGVASDMSNGTGLDVFTWSLCATLEFLHHSPSHPWPSPGSGTILTWDPITRCQQGEIAVAGYFYAAAYSSDRFQLVEYPIRNVAQVADCDAIETDLTAGDLGFVEFSEGARARGCNPCFVDCSASVNVTPTSWSRIKTLIGK